jgi:hypothetical protein
LLIVCACAIYQEKERAAALVERDERKKDKKELRKRKLESPANPTPTQRSAAAKLAAGETTPAPTTPVAKKPKNGTGVIIKPGIAWVSTQVIALLPSFDAVYNNSFYRCLPVMCPTPLCLPFPRSVHAAAKPTLAPSTNVQSANVGLRRGKRST